MFGNSFVSGFMCAKYLYKKTTNAFKNKKESDIFQFCNIQISRWL